MNRPSLPGTTGQGLVLVCAAMICFFLGLVAAGYFVRATAPKTLIAETAELPDSLVASAWCLHGPSDLHWHFIPLEDMESAAEQAEPQP